MKFEKKKGCFRKESNSAIQGYFYANIIKKIVQSKLLVNAFEDVKTYEISRRNFVPEVISLLKTLDNVPSYSQSKQFPYKDLKRVQVILPSAPFETESSNYPLHLLTPQ